jgi:hypothetical protein
LRRGILLGDRRRALDGQARPAELPALNEFLRAFPGRFRRPEGAQALERYLTGLLTELPDNNCATMAHAVPGTSEPGLPASLTNLQWEEADLHRPRVGKMVAEATWGAGVLGRDDPGFAKRG